MLPGRETHPTTGTSREPQRQLQPPPVTSLPGAEPHSPTWHLVLLEQQLHRLLPRLLAVEGRLRQHDGVRIQREPHLLSAVAITVAGRGSREGEAGWVQGKFNAAETEAALAAKPVASASRRWTDSARSGRTMAPTPPRKLT